MLAGAKGIIRAFRTGRLVLEFDKIPFYYQRLGTRRLINWMLAESGFRLKSPLALGYPTLFQIEPTNLCNLRCPMCYVRADTRIRASMGFDEYKQIIDEIGDYTLLLQLWGWGEPFMNHEFCRMIRYAKNTGMKIITSTNGHFFENEQDVDELIHSGLDVLMFALDGLDADTYEKYRRRGDFERTMSGLELLIRRKRELKSPLPLINLRMLVTRENEDQAEAMKGFGAEIGADVLTFKTLWNINRNERIDALLPRNAAYRRARYEEDGKAVRIPNSCRRFWNNPVVYRGGEVVPCYFHSSNDSLGNVFSAGSRGVRRIWFGWNYTRLRLRFIRGRMANTPCSECALNFAPVERFASHAFWYRPHPESFDSATSFRAGAPDTLHYG